MSDAGAVPPACALPVSSPPATTAATAADAATSALQTAWAMVQRGNVAKNEETLNEFLTEVGVDDQASFEYLVRDPDLLEQLQLLLKPVKSRQLGDCVSALLNG